MVEKWYLWCFRRKAEVRSRHKRAYTRTNCDSVVHRDLSLADRKGKAYRWMSERASVRPGATLSASISWESAAGTFLSKSSTDVSNSGGTTIGETLQVDVTTFAGGKEIPSYNCTTSFRFTGNQDPGFSYAHNSVSWTCVSDPVVAWCRYF